MLESSKSAELSRKDEDTDFISRTGYTEAGVHWSSKYAVYMDAKSVIPFPELRKLIQ